MANAGLDQNSRATLTAVSSTDGKTIVPLYAHPITHRLLVGSTSGIVGPLSSTDNAIVRWDGTTGLTIKDSPVLIGDTGVVSYSGAGNSAIDVNQRQLISNSGGASFSWDSALSFASNGQGNHAILDTSGLGSDYTFTFPQITGTFLVYSTPPVADGTYTVGAKLTGGGVNGTITVTNGIITAIQEAS